MESESVSAEVLGPLSIDIGRPSSYLRGGRGYLDTQSLVVALCIHCLVFHIDLLFHDMKCTYYLPLSR